MNGNSPIICACEYGNVDVMRLLLDNGANINHINNRGYNSLIKSCNWCNNNSDLVRLLINEGSDLYHRTPWGHTAFMTACICTKYEIAKILLINDIDISHRDCGGNSILRIIFDHIKDLPFMRIESKNDYMNIIKLIVSSYDNYRKHIDDIN